MNHRLIVLALAILAAPLCAQTAPPGPVQQSKAPAPAAKAEAAPTIPDKIRGDFFKAKSDLAEAQAAVQAAQQQFQTTVSALLQACGAKYQPQINEAPGPQHGELICVPKPANLAK